MVAQCIIMEHQKAHIPRANNAKTASNLLKAIAKFCQLANTAVIFTTMNTANVSKSAAAAKLTETCCGCGVATKELQNS